MVKQRQLTEEQASQIFKNRFSPGTTPRSTAYQRGYQEGLRRNVFPDSPKDRCPYKVGSAECDAWFYGLDSVDNSIACFWYRLEEAEEAAA